VGGDLPGAVVLGRYHHYFAQDDVQTLCVINALRPHTGSVEEIVDVVRQLSAHSRLPVNGIISNTNLARETGADEVLYGHAIIAEAARQLSIPIVQIYCLPEVMQQLPKTFVQENARILQPICLHMRYDWMDLSV